MGFWRHRVIGLIALAVLAGTPVLGAVCAGVCAPGQGHHAAPAAPSHAASASCHQAPPAVAATLGALPDDGCAGHDGASVALATARPSGRADAWAGLEPIALTGSISRLDRRPAISAAAAGGRRDGPPPRPHAPIVLRI